MERISEIISRITPLDEKLMEEAQKRLNNLTKPQGSLGRLEEFAKRIVGISGNPKPVLRRKVIFTMAGDHGVVEEGVSAYPQEVTSQMVYNFLKGGAGVNVLASHVGAEVIVVDMGVGTKIQNSKLKIQNLKFKVQNFKDKKINYGTKNIAKGPAMKREEAIKSICAGIEVFEEEYKKGKIDIIGIGDMGIGNTTPSSAITAVFTKKPVERVTGRGTGIDKERWQNKVNVVKKALEINKPDSKDPIDVLSKVGGFEIGGLVGVIIGAASHRVPVVLDGFITSASALIAYELEPKTKNYMIASHSSVEIGHKAILDHIGLKPILNLDMRLGEGTGAALGISIIEAGVKILTQMATFKEAGVSEKK